MASTQNYRTALLRARDFFMSQDYSKQVKHWNLEQDDNFIYLKFAGSDYSISRKDGTVLRKRTAFGQNDWEEADFDDGLTIYDLLCFSDPDCKAAGTYTLMHNLAKVQGSTSNSSNFAGNGYEVRYGKAVEKKQELFLKNCEILGGVPGTKGDISMTIPVFMDLKVNLQYWEADEDFPPILNVYADANTLSYMHYETVWYMMGYLMEELLNAHDEENSLVSV